MFAVLKTTRCCLCSEVIDCHEQLNHYLHDGKIRYACDECQEILDILPDLDVEIVRLMRKEQERWK